MRRRGRPWKWGATALLVFSLLPVIPAAGQGRGLALSVGPVRVVFEGDGGGTSTVSAYVSGGVESDVTVRLFDAAPRRGGGWVPLPFGSTPGTLRGIVDVTPTDWEYVPNNTEQEFPIEVSVPPGVVLDAHWAELVVTVTPKEPGPAGTISSSAGVAIQIVQIPEGGRIPAADLSLRIDSLRVWQVRPWTAIDRLLPNIPGVIGHGPANIRVDGRNDGEYFLDSTTRIEIARISPLALLPFFRSSPPRPTLTVDLRPRYLIPGQVFHDIASTRFSAARQTTVDSLPFIGFVTVKATLRGSLGPIAAKPVSRTTTLLIFPWSEFLFLFFVYLVQREWRHRRGRRVNVTAEPPPPSLRRRVREVLGRFVPRISSSSSSTPASPTAEPAPPEPAPPTTPVPDDDRPDIGEGNDST